MARRAHDEQSRQGVLSPDALQQIVMKDWLEYPRVRPLLLQGMDSSLPPGEDHKQLRKAMTPAFYLKLDGPNRHVLPAWAVNEKEAIPEADKVFPMYEWSWAKLPSTSSAALFGYKTDCLHSPHNEFAVAFEQLLQLQSGPNLAKLVAILSIPGTIQPLALPVDRSSSNRCTASAPFPGAALQDRRPADDTTTKKDIMSLLARTRK
ncbi:hypothetical protein B0H14DRAFT_3531591 [Mycena olivaceomarginata]|nr:hypothetical protein B0H14DRAFT_3531591 [Mycena olivaceomarginata]